MPRRARMAAVARLAAALVSLSLSGAPALAALHAPAEAHRCSCPRGAQDQHACECVRCRHAALSAQASDEALPPCHRAAAKAALSEATGRDSGAPCVEGTCGNGARPPVSVLGVEPFCLLAVWMLQLALSEESHQPRLAPPSPRCGLEPETPPPRRS